MAERILHPEWRDENETTKYPFGSNASLTNGTDVILEGIFLDAILYPIGGSVRLFMPLVTVAHNQVTLSIGDDVNGILATGSFDLVSPPDRVTFQDAFGRPAGVLVSEPNRLAIFQSWAIGEHSFGQSDTEFAATVVVPTPEIGLRGVQLEDGSLFTGEIWMVGDDGIVLQAEDLQVPSPVCGDPAIDVAVIRVDAIGDPLFRRRLCTDDNLFVTPRFVKTITIDDGRQRVRCGPDEAGDFKLTVNNDLAEDTVLRIRPTEAGIVIEAEGSGLESVR
jgi:hypothetical protein